MLLIDLIRRLNEDSKQTFIIVTHDKNVAEMTDRIIQMKDGVIIKENVHREEETELEMLDLIAHLEQLDQLYLSKNIEKQEYKHIQSKVLEKLVDAEITSTVHARSRESNLVKQASRS